MTKGEVRMSNEDPLVAIGKMFIRHSHFVIRNSSFALRHSKFVIRTSSFEIHHLRLFFQACVQKLATVQAASCMRRSATGPVFFVSRRK